MAVATPNAGYWRLRVEPVGAVETLLARLRAEAGGAPVALGMDLPLGVPREYAAAHCTDLADFPAFLDRLAAQPGRFFEVCDGVEEIGPGRPFYPRHGRRGMTRLAHAQALGLDVAGLHRRCDRATPHRPAGAPLFWTLGANQVGKGALSAWRDLLLPARAGPEPPALWPFAGPLRTLLRPGGIVIAETYPAEALRQLGLRLDGSKRRQADRQAQAAALRAVMAELSASPDPALADWLLRGFGADAAGEDRFDSLIGLLCLLQVLLGRRTDQAPDDPWIQRWEGWVLGQTPH